MKFAATLLLALAVALAIATFVFAQSCGAQSGGTDPDTTKALGTKPAVAPVTGTTGSTPATPPAAVPATPSQPSTPKVIAKPEANPVVDMETNYGTIKVELFRDKAPISTENFLSYVRDGYYNGTIFHRVVKGFVIQAGGFTADMKEKPAKAPIKNEAANGLKNLRGTLSVARTNEIDSGAAHFFINLVDNTRLDHTGNEPVQYGYAVFGKVIGGMDVVDKIADVKVANKGPFQNVPVEPVTIVKATIVQAQPKPAVKTEAKTEAQPGVKPGETKVEKKQIGEPESGTTTK